jgi:protein SCO1/2
MIALSYLERAVARSRLAWRWSLAGLGAAALVAMVIVSQAMTDEQRRRTPASMFERRSGGPLPKLWRVPAFELVSQRMQPVSDLALRGHVWIASFLFTSCGTVCPMLSAKLALLQRRLQQPDLRFVSFSVDPERDTPKRLAAYAQRFRPDETRWQLLSSSRVALDGILRGMHVSAEPSQDQASPIAHSSLLFLTDADGWVRGVYDSTDASGGLDALERDVRSLEAASQPVAPSLDGASLYRQLGCNGCHAEARLAPTLVGLMGQRIAIAGDAQVEVDREYLRESIVAPSAKLSAGYRDIMPSYEAELSREELDALVGYVSRL